MSLTPIYDELRELRVAESSDGARDVRPSPPRLIPGQAGLANVDRLAGRHGLGGRHRRSSP